MGRMPSAAVTVRRATPADNALLAEIGARAFSDTFAVDNTPENMAAYLAASFSPDKQAAELADPRGVFLIAEVAGQTAGYARLCEGTAPGPLAGAAGAQRPIEIVRFYALKPWIGQGVGAALMTACLAEARQRGCDALWLDVWERNPRAIAFYRRWGFVEVGTQAFQLGDDRQTDVLMQRAVSAAQAAA
jgi:GNAT superfamily N-acetyltransferase